MLGFEVRFTRFDGCMCEGKVGVWIRVSLECRCGIEWDEGDEKEDGEN